MSSPLGALDTELPFVEINIAPFERDDLTAPQARLSAQQHDQVRCSV
jgi:hypothetical protein